MDAVSVDRTIVIVDDFYRRPDEVLERALRESYTHDGMFPGERSHSTVHGREFVQLFERHVGREITRMESMFQFQPAKYDEQSFVHNDGCDWAAVVYLNKGRDGEPGTRFYRHRDTGMAVHTGEPGTVWPHLRDGGKLDMWEVTLTVPMRFSRLVLYNANMFHRNASAWGSTVHDSRLVQSIFIATGAIDPAVEDARHGH